MVRRGRHRSRLALIATIAVICSGGWLRHTHALSIHPTGAVTPGGQASPRVETLPLSFAPPLDPGIRLVALVASDIDADGDLDLVASDGSLDLLVWINDGAGHLTRQYGKRASGWNSDSLTADSDAVSSRVSVVGSSAAQVDPGRLRLFLLDRHISSRSPQSLSPQSWYARSQNPRAPPLSLSAL
jgi:hypothetical protein